MQFSQIKEIDSQKKESWKNKIFLTFDIDWAGDEVLEDTLDLIEKHDVAATFFCTHKTNILDRMRANPKIELGIHPNFNFLLNGDFRYGSNMQDVIDYYLTIIPEAKSVRSHALTNQSNMLDYFSSVGLRYECNYFIPYQSGITLKPFMHWDDALVRVPFGWEDDIHCLNDKKDKVKNIIQNMEEGIKVFNFHPIHIFLNSENLERYKSVKKYLDKTEVLRQHIYTGYGVKDILIELLEDKGEK